jgi:hypothetical protein
LIRAFIAANQDRFGGAASICRVLTEHGCQIAPRTFWARKTRPPSKRQLSDLVLTEVSAGIYEFDERGRRQPESLYGALKMWAHLNRQGIEVASCTDERLMRTNGRVGVSRAKRVVTTVPDPAADRAPDLVDRQFRVAAPNTLFVGDFTYVPMVPGGSGIPRSSSTHSPRRSWGGSVPHQGHRVRRTCDPRSDSETTPGGEPVTAQNDSPLRRRIAIHISAFR